MKLCLLDTNIILDDYYEDRPRHKDVLKFIGQFRYGELGYMNKVILECSRKLSDALSTFSESIKNEVLAKVERGKDWDQIKLDKREKLLSQTLRTIQEDPNKYGENTPFVTTLFKSFSRDIATFSKSEMNDLLLILIPRGQEKFLNHLRARFTFLNNYWLNDKVVEDLMSKVRSILESEFTKPYDSYDWNIALETLTFALNDQQGKKAYESITFYTADEKFLKNLRKLRIKSIILTARIILRLQRMYFLETHVAMKSL